MRNHELPFELYDLGDDPADRHDLAVENPQMVNDLLERLRSRETELDGE